MTAALITDFAVRAHHAAAHAVARYAMGLRLKDVALNGAGCGYIPSRRLRSRADDARRIVMLAGSLAEVAHSRGDLTEAITRCCDGWNPRQIGRGAYFDPSGSFWTQMAYEYLVENEAGHAALVDALLSRSGLRAREVERVLDGAA